ncbi:hypothetical protein D8674_013300 [Pyrus ussuriensis x Pyrus communis]|uniref:Uncharacterized protein n=1 Tax=Pyrus ussuriensis x Pyrus communis TaxID=2448454 RepID=A0A5N5GU63_9ROSA|nr:hypothetical protein D8674_013300 [Pyrus ussuriensis x Pyrus communis]
MEDTLSNTTYNYIALMTSTAFTVQDGAASSRQWRRKNLVHKATEQLDLGTSVGAATKLDMTTQGVQLATKEEEACRGRVSKLSQALHVLGLIREKFNEAQLGAFRISCFGHLQGVDKLAFSGQLIHDLSLCRVANQGLKT